MVREHTEKVKRPARSSCPSRSVTRSGGRRTRACSTACFAPRSICCSSRRRPGTARLPGRCRDERGACRSGAGLGRQAGGERDRRRGERGSPLLGQHAQWLARSGGRTALGPSGVTREALPDRVPLLQRLPPGETVEAARRPAAVPWSGFIRYLATISRRYWKGYGAEARRGGDVARWFWARPHSVAAACVARAARRRQCRRRRRLVAAWRADRRLPR